MSTFDRLNYKLTNWQKHAIHTIKTYGFEPVDSLVQIEYQEQEDGWNYGPIACAKIGWNCGCAKIMEIYGWIAPGSLPQIGKTPGGFRSVVTEFFSALLTTYDDDLRVRLRSNVGINVPALETIEESNIPSITASSIAAHESNIPSITASSIAGHESNIPSITASSVAHQKTCFRQS